MRSILGRTASLGLVIAAVSVGSTARADILQDILSITTAARDRATQARDNAAAARDRATQARDNAATAITTAAAARDTAIEMRNEMLQSATALATGVRDFVDEAVADLEQDVADELAGRDEFVNGGGAPAFRQELLVLLERLETLVNALNLACGGPEAGVDFTREMMIINAAPDRLLYPSYRAMVAETPGMLEWFSDLLDRAAMDILVIEGMLTETSEPVDGDLLDQEEHDCSYVLANLADIRAATSDLTRFALAARGFGAVLKAAGTTEIEKNGALWGWAGGSIKNNRVKKLGVLVDGLGTAVSGLTGYVSVKTRYCAAVGIEVEARDRDLEILANQNRILKLLEAHTPTTRPRP